MTDTSPLPDNVEYAGFWVRMGATLLDTIILLLITLPLTYLFYGPGMLEKQGQVLLGGWDFVINWLFPVLPSFCSGFSKELRRGKCSHQ